MFNGERAVMVMNEFRALEKRGFEPYSVGHQVMYQVPITLMRDQKKKILDVGFGIGWGLAQMVATEVIERYVGFEPDTESYIYVKRRFGKTKGVELINAPFAGHADEFDHVFCIEVIEHVEMSQHSDFIKRMADSCTLQGTVWISTPCKLRNDRHGVRPTEEWLGIIREHFSDVVVHQDQWTTLYVCQ